MSTYLIKVLRYTLAITTAIGLQRTHFAAAMETWHASELFASNLSLASLTSPIPFNGAAMKTNLILAAWLMNVGVGAVLIGLVFGYDLGIVDFAACKSPPWCLIAPYFDARAGWFALGVGWTLFSMVTLLTAENAGSALKLRRWADPSRNKYPIPLAKKLRLKIPEDCKGETLEHVTFELRILVDEEKSGRE